MTIKEIRSRTETSQQKFSEMVGIPKRTIVDWETGRRKPTEYLVKLLDFYVEKHGWYKK